MKVLIAGVDGYLGWTLALYLSERGHDVGGIDKYYRREWVREMNSQSATPILDITDRLKAYSAKYNKELRYFEGDISEYKFLENVFKEFKPEVFVHLAEMPSAAYSMIDVDHANWTMKNNIIGTMNALFAIRDISPNTHLLKLGTMGEYGTPNIDIPEGFFTINYRGREDTLPFPKQAGSWYHQTKVHDTNNIMLANKIWGIRSTDIMQGVVFGTKIDEMGDNEKLLTRFDFDQCFGTAINRFCAQAVIGHALTPYGKGSQRRGFLPLRDSMQCLTLALENPPTDGEYRVFNQFEEVYNIYELAEKVQKIGKKLGLNVKIENLENPRVELEEHYFNPDHKHLLDLGYKPTHNIDREIEITMKDLIKYRGRIEECKEVLIPDITWGGERKKSNAL